MRALVTREFGGLDRLVVEDLPEPRPGDGEILIDVHAVGINYADSLMVAGNYQTKPDFPFGPGLECAGVVAETGPGCTRLRPGDRVMALVDHSAMAERVVTREADAQRMPEGMDMATGGAFPVAYVSSHVALRWQARLEAGETLLVLGAAGGVGLTAVEIGKAMGARVIAGASSPDKLALAREHGADEGIDYAREDLKARVDALTGGEGVDVVYDPVGGELFDPALSSLAWGGRILLIGFVGGVPRIPANRLLVKHRSAMGSSMRFYRQRRPDLLERTWDELARWHAEDRLRPHVSETWPLDRGADAIRALTERRAVGKVVVTVR